MSNSKERERKEYTDDEIRELEKENWCYLCHRDFDQLVHSTSTFYYQNRNPETNMRSYRFCQDCADHLVNNIFESIINIGDKRNE